MSLLSRLKPDIVTLLEAVARLPLIVRMFMTTTAAGTTIKLTDGETLTGEPAELVEALGKALIGAGSVADKAASEIKELRATVAKLEAAQTSQNATCVLPLT